MAESLYLLTLRIIVRVIFLESQVDDATLLLRIKIPIIYL